jgi:FkbM family methyltransferase
MRVIKGILRRLLKRRGLRLINPDFYWGIDPFADVRRFALAQSRPVSMMFDVGAHYGETAIRAFGEFPNVRIVSFEPHPDSFASLQRALRGRDECVAVNSAVGDTVGDLELHVYEESCLNSLTPNAAWAVQSSWNSKSTVKVPCTTLDQYCEKNRVSGIDLLKIDTEGFDLQVLHGAKSLLESKAVRFIFVEFTDLQPKEGVHGGALLPIDSFLRPYGFRFATSYLDSVGTKGELFFTANALFVLQP